MNNLEKFIKDNGLTFEDGSQGNINIVTLCGYALYQGLTKDDCITAADSDDEVNTEISRVFEYAQNNNYGDWWKVKSNRETYKI